MIERLQIRIPAGAAGEFSSPESQLRATAVIRIKDLGHFAKNADGRLHLSTHTPLTQRSRSGLTMPLCRHSVGTYQETNSRATRQVTHMQSQSSQLTEPLWTGPGPRSHCGLILAR